MKAQSLTEGLKYLAYTKSKSTRNEDILYIRTEDISICNFAIAQRLDKQECQVMFI